MSKHIKMVSRSAGEEEEEWLEENNQSNGRSQSGIGFKKGGRGSQLSRLEKIFLVLLFLLTVALIAVIIALIIKEDKDDNSATATVGETSQKESQVCLSTECVTAAASMESKIDHSVHPCDDFYKFACGKWMNGRVIPEDRSSVTTFTDLRNDVDIVLKNLLETPVSSTDTDYTKKVKTLYASCLNYDLINQLGVQPFLDLLNTEFGGWPLTTKDWDESTFEFTKWIIKLNLNECYPVVSFFSGVDQKNSTKRVLKLDQSGFGLPSQKYYQVPRNDSMLMAYQTLIYKIGETFGFANPATAEQEVKDIVDFEIRLADIAVPPEERRDSNKLYNPMTIKELATNYSQILDWKDLIFTIMNTPGIDVSDVTEDEIIINLSPTYYERLIDVLKNTPTRTLANYLLWRQIRDLTFTQGDLIKDIYKDYNKVLYGVNTRPPRYRTCVSYATNNMGLAVGKLFIKDNFDAESKTVALAMIQDLHHSFDEILREIDWMDDKTKIVAEEKNRYIAPKIGYPEELNNETYMTQIYENYTYHEDQYLENALINLREGYKYSMKRLREPVDKTKAIYAPSNVNAFYSATRNQIMFPAGILQPPFFSKTFPRSLNYGGIGVVIGHEITHGFDDRGRQYDKEGNLVQWWSDIAEKRFKVKSQCIVEQYSNYTVDGINMNLNGITTQGENIADNGGLKQAFNAYRNWVKRQGKEEPPLPGLKFSSDQLFFINFAQIWCSLMRDGDAINRIRSGVHSPGKFRVIGTTQNSEDFSRVFQCPTTSKMNPKKKCSIW